MSKASVWIVAVTLAVAALPSVASAAPVGEVIKACDDMHAKGQTCNYGIKGNAIVGCTNDTVFVCPADGSRKCSGGANTSGKCNDDGTTAHKIPTKAHRPLSGDALLAKIK